MLRLAILLGLAAASPSLAQTYGSICETPGGICPLISPQLVGSSCTCANGAEGVTR